MEFYAVDHIFPQWDIWQQYLRNVSTVALSLDCLVNSHPVEVPVTHPTQVLDQGWLKPSDAPDPGTGQGWLKPVPCKGQTGTLLVASS